MSPVEMNKDGKVFFERLDSSVQEPWAWRVLSCIRKFFPDADIWTTGGADKKYIDIRIGRKNIRSLKGRPVLFLQVTDSSKTKARLRIQRNHRKDASIEVTIDPVSFIDDIVLNAWFEKLAEHLTRWPDAMKGVGNVPANYIRSEMIDDLADEAELLPLPIISRRQVPLNQILYGPPGTGKTFNTVTAAMSIVAPESMVSYDERKPESRKALQEEFQRHLQSGQIVFCTFHQSFSYEDFVEGLRASSKNGELHYEVEPGLFKQLCERADLGTTASDDPFDKAIEVLVERCSDPEARPLLATVKGKKFEVEFQGNKTFRVFPRESSVENPYYVANIESVRKLYQGQDKKGMYNTSYVAGMLKYLKEECRLPEYRPLKQTAGDRRNFVLIIDEINRGNVSRILGELITLIEPGKRSGNPEALSVVLPYSKQHFSIPSNVYIIGTMNTADRSLVGLDIALRRRFAFTEMAPDPERLADIDIGNINVGDLLRVINQRIEVLLDREHCIGHAYFLGLNNESTLADLAYIFSYQIIPLLQEYFFEDWERISWVLNDQNKPGVTHRFIVEPTDLQENMASLFGKQAQSLQSKRWRLNTLAFEFEESFTGILSVEVAKL